MCSHGVCVLCCRYNSRSNLCCKTMGDFGTCASWCQPGAMDCIDPTDRSQVVITQVRRQAYSLFAVVSSLSGPMELHSEPHHIASHHITSHRNVFRTCLCTVHRRTPNKHKICSWLPPWRWSSMRPPFLILTTSLRVSRTSDLLVYWSTYCGSCCIRTLGTCLTDSCTQSLPTHLQSLHGT
jgi:hypothetical protein